MAVPFVLETERLRIRPFEPGDFNSYRELVNATAESSNHAPPYLLFQWYSLSAVVQPMLYQFPYGDRAVIQKSTNQIVGAAGFVPCLDFFSRIPELGIPASVTHKTPEVGLFYAIHPDHRKKGFASEAVLALIEHAFQDVSLQRLVATTSYDNLASQGVMQKIGMRICRNPSGIPEWLQIVGVIENPVRADF